MKTVVKVHKRIISVILSVIVMTVALNYPLTVFAAYENTHSNTGNQAEDLVAVAKTQIGYMEGNLEGTISGSNNYTKYNVWNGTISGYGSNGYGYAWCHSFVSWCANQAGIGTDIIPKTAGTSTGKSFFTSRSLWQNSAYQGGSYTPKRGDIVYFSDSASLSAPSHVGIVTEISGSILYTIEGNTSDKVAAKSYSLSDDYIIGYGCPNYASSSITRLSYEGEMANYIRNLIGTEAKEWGGGTGTQCVELPKYFIEQYFGIYTKTIALGNGNSIYKGIVSAFPDTFERIDYYDGFVPRPGDIISFESQPSPNEGHVALVYEVSGNTYKIAEQWKGSGTVRSNTKTIQAGKYGVSYTIIGVARPKTGTPPVMDTECNIPYPRPSTSTLIKVTSPLTQNDYVKWVQYAMNEIIGAGLTVDGFYGELTAAAVKSFQTKYGLGADGIVGAETIGKIVELRTAVAPKTPSQPTLNIDAGTSTTNTIFSWNACDNTNWYDIRYYDSNGNNLATIWSSTKTTYYTNLPNGTYYANVAAVNENGNHTFSTDVWFTVGFGDLVPKATTSYNGHVYSVYDNTVDYDVAKSFAENHMGGHIATITSAEENAVVSDLIQSGECNGYWLGASDGVSEGNWQWSTRESFSYSNWSSSQPDNAGGRENNLEIWRDGTWNDLPSTSNQVGFVIEIEPLIEANVQVYNGHMYYRFDNNLSWTEAKAYCEMFNGHLVTIESKEENAFIQSMIQSGAYDFYWISNDISSSYSNFETGEPNSDNGIEGYYHMYKSSGLWNDLPNAKYLKYKNGFICEVDTASFTDISLLQKHLLNKSLLDENQVTLADMDSNGIINSIDMALLKRKLS